MILWWDHDKIFEVDVFSGETILGSGKGHSKQEAEKEAAFNAISILDRER
jgi:dsRNA-specific ribonuclease